MDILHCTEDGSYYAHCTGRNDDRVDCNCLNANKFEKPQQTPQVVQRNVKPNCGKLVDSVVICVSAPDKRGFEDNSKILFLISQRKHVVTPY